MFCNIEKKFMDLADTLIIIHASLGGIGLLSGIVSMSSKKGRKLHKTSGKIFAFSMVLSSLISIPVCFMPGHENMFLFAIAVFTIYLVFSGQRALLYKLKNLENIQTWKDWLISLVMFAFGIALIIEGAFKVLYQNGPTVLFYFFGLLSVFLAIQDFRFFARKNKSATEFIERHIGQMSGAFTASFTAFLSAGLQLKHWLVWILPTLFISIWIIYWTRKYKSPRTKTS
jgi:uncharacterized membrane protein